MAMTSPGGITDQFSVLALARWQAFRNSLRRKQKQYELVFTVMYWLGGLGIFLGGGALFFAATFFLLPKSTAMLGVVFWILFLVWQFVPVVLEGQSPAVDFREIARYPITFKLYYLMSLAYGFFDPAAATAVFWSLCTWLAITLRKPEWALRAALAFALFILLNLLMNRVVFAWVSRIMQTRKGRERLVMFGMLCAVMSQFMVYYQPRGGVSQTRARMLLTFFTNVHTFSPAGMAQAIISKGWVAATTAVVAGLAGVIILLGVVLFRQLWRTYCGEIGSEGSKRSGAVQVQPGWKLPGLSETTSAVVEKELRYMMKDPKLVMNVIMIWAVCFLMTTGSQFMKNAFKFNLQNSTYVLPFTMGYSFLVISPQVFNMFWSDATGFQRWLLSPIPTRQIIAAKNISVAVLVAINMVVITGIARLRGPIQMTQLALTLLCSAYVGLFMFGAGNFFSVWFPKRVDPTKMTRKNVSEASGISSMLLLAALGGSWFLVTVIATGLHMPWLPFAVAASLLVLGAVFYQFSLAKVPRIAEKGLDKLLAELG
ncbi:MAG: hypothetical protein JWO13_2155 [Acidobacteriales bacterium]|nr:hypothetical protein [Terriglobales bacterium]